MHNHRTRQILWLLAALVCVCALLCAFAGAEEIAATAVEDVPAMPSPEGKVDAAERQTDEGESAPAESAPVTAELIDASAQAETQTVKPEIKTAKGRLDGVLQAGGFPRIEDDETPRFALQSDLAGAKQAIYEGLLARSNEILIYDYGIDVADLGPVFQSVVNDHPELFYIDAESEYSYSYINTVAYALYPFYDMSYGPAHIAQFDETCAAILAQIDPSWSDLQKILFLHDYLVTHCEYDNDYQNYNAYNALVDRVAVCQGYALALCYLGKQAGLDIRYVTSYDIAHAWNAVYLNGEFFYIDCTWDDPANGWYEAYCSHENFLRSRDGMVTTNHTSDDWVCDNENVYGNDVSSTYYEGTTDAWWQDVYTAIPQIGSLCAYSNSSMGNTVILRDLVSGGEQTVTLPGEVVWPVFNQPMYYTSLFYSFTAWEGAFYLTTAETIYRLGTDGGVEAVYTLTDAEKSLGYLYGIVNDGGRLYYNVGTKPALGYPPRTEEYTRTELVLAGHVHNLVYYPAQAPGCGVPGWEAYEVCTECGYSTYVEIAPLDHEYTYDTVEYATCTEPGIFRYTCINCGYSYDLTIPALGHDLMYHDSMEPSCTQSGWTEYYTCFRCDYTTYTELPPLGHLPDHHDYLEPTTEEEGNLEYWYCPGCGSYFLDEDCTMYATWEEILLPMIPDHVHTLITYSAKAPTCTEHGWEAYEACIDCDYTTFVEIPPTGHMTDYFPYKPATPWEDGNVEYWHCTACGAYFTDAAYSVPASWDEIVIPKLTEHTHDFVHIDGQAPTCTEPGWTDGEYCESCGYTTCMELPATGHTPEHIPYKEPTVWEDGNVEYWHCLGCGKYFLDMDCGSETTADTLILPRLDNPDPPAPNVLRGDVNGDNEINAKDVTSLRRSLAGGYSLTADNPAMDVNKDGRVNAKDATTLRRYIVGGYGVTIS